MCKYLDLESYKEGHTLFNQVNFFNYNKLGSNWR